ncbi:hypothetical protein [Paracoccus suum]|uniref:hypothetical protein n=1 Tax=Paracoccus suum TaxID=2259340 RepID=UPI0013B05F2C|nr:hypothetical protein [Paracoccus suum]
MPYLIPGIGHLNLVKISYNYLNENNIPREDSSWIALHFSPGLALEVSLKACLSQLGFSTDQLKTGKFGHRLDALTNAVEESLDGNPQAFNKFLILRPVLGELIDCIGADYLNMNYRYLEGDEVFSIRPGDSFLNAISLVESVCNITEFLQSQKT